MKGRRYGAASNLAVHVARRAVEKAGWEGNSLRNTWIFAASSRGNVAELLGANGWRRPVRRFSASNTMHSEIAAAVSIELGIRGPWQMVSNGCSSGLDALGLAWMAVASGAAPRALVVAVDLPLLPELLRDFRETHLLSSSDLNDPYSTSSDGFLPGEGAAALTLERGQKGSVELEKYAANSDAYDSLVIPENGAPLAELIRTICQEKSIQMVCPHATGTKNQALAEPRALRSAFSSKVPPILLLKPFTGHTLGASGLLDVGLLAAAIHAGKLPANLPGLTCPDSLNLVTVPQSMTRGERVLKISSGMGGHNAAVILRKI